MNSNDKETFFFVALTKAKDYVEKHNIEIKEESLKKMVRHYLEGTNYKAAKHLIAVPRETEYYLISTNSDNLLNLAESVFTIVPTPKHPPKVRSVLNSVYNHAREAGWTGEVGKEAWFSAVYQQGLYELLRNERTVAFRVLKGGKILAFGYQTMPPKDEEIEDYEDDSND